MKLKISLTIVCVLSSVTLYAKPPTAALIVALQSNQFNLIQHWAPGYDQIDWYHLLREAVAQENMEQLQKLASVLEQNVGINDRVNIVLRQTMHMPGSDQVARSVMHDAINRGKLPMVQALVGLIGTLGWALKSDPFNPSSKPLERQLVHFARANNQHEIAAYLCKHGGLE